MSTFKKVMSSTLTLTTSVWLSGAMMFVPVAHGQSVTDLQAQIAALLAQIQTLQSNLSAQTGGGSVVSASFTRDLTVGSTGSDVKALQQFLNGHGAMVSASGAGSPGNESSYFGNATKAALAKWQAANGISPAAGYFGPKTRAAIAAMMVGGSTGGSTGGGTNVPAPASGLAVSMASDNPSAGSLISSAASASARVKVLSLNYTAGNSGAVNITGLKFNKNGVLADSAISSAYLIESGKVIAQYSSVNGGIITFSGLSLSVGAGQTRTFALAIDIASGQSAGNTVSFGLAAASAVTASDVSGNALTPSGMFPVNGSVFTVTSVSNPSLATLTISSSSVGTTVYAGTTGVLVSQWTASASNSPVNLGSINFKVTGSANKTDLKNVKLMVNGTQVGQTLSSVNADGSAYFDLSSSPAKLNTGSSNIQLIADVMGSPSYNFQFQLLNTYDVYAIDTQYNVPVSVTLTGGAGILVSINQGQITLNVDSATPTSNIAKGASGTTLAKFALYAAGEAVKVKFLQVQLDSTGGTLAFNGSSVDTHLRNLQIVDDAGLQIGTTISSLNNVDGATSGQCDGSSTTTTLCNFGTSASPINYTVPANTTRVLSVKVDVQSTASFSTLKATMPAQSQNLQGLTSSQTGSTGSANGSTLTLATNPLLVALNGAVGNQSYARGSTNVKIGSYVLTASSAEGENVSNFTVTMNASSSNIQNLKAKVGSTQIGSTYSTVTNGDYTFSGTINVPVGGTAIVDLYADVLSSASGAMGSITSFKSCTGTGANTFASVSCAAGSGSLPVSGQTLTVSGSLTLTVSNNNSLASRQIVMGSTGVSLAKILLTDTTGIEAVRVQQLKFTINTASTKGAAFTNLKLYDGAGNAITGAGPISLSSATPTFVADFNFGSAAVVTVPQAGTLTLELRGDVAPFTTGSNIENATSAVTIAATSDIVAYGNSSNISATVTGTGTTYATLTVLRSKLNLAGAALGTDSQCPNYGGAQYATVNRSRTATDYVTCLKFSADPSGGSVNVNTLSLTFSGAAVTGTFSVQLIDPATGSNYDGSASNATCAAGSAASCTVTFTFNGGSGTPISAGTTKGVAVLISSLNFSNVSQQYDGMDITLGARANVDFGDGTSGIGATASGLNLSGDVSVPVILTHVDYQ